MSRNSLVPLPALPSLLWYISLLKSRNLGYFCWSDNYLLHCLRPLSYVLVLLRGMDVHGGGGKSSHTSSSCMFYLFTMPSGLQTPGIHGSQSIHTYDQHMGRKEKKMSWCGNIKVLLHRFKTSSRHWAVRENSSEDFQTTSSAPGLIL